MNNHRVALVHKSLGEITPRRAVDKANASGQWFKFYIPVMPRKGYGYKTERAAMVALDKRAKSLPNPDDWRGLYWVTSHENEPALTIAV